ncbi:MAG TPA: GYF domain-containing protein [Tepidisphaeraceae bacterium]|nr:GYF domain-containing protein [Tepidisphaeraceae bacterium]
MADAWYYAQGGHQLGPVPLERLRGMLAAGEVRPDDLVWADGMADWQPARDVEMLRPADVPPVAADPEPLVAPPADAPPPQETAAPPWHAPQQPTPGTVADAPMGYYNPSAGYGPKPQTMAITSLCLGIGSFVLCAVPYLNLLTWAGAVCAILFGVVARNRVARGEEEGGGMALTGIILGVTHLLLIVVAVIILIIFGVAIARSGGR